MQNVATALMRSVKSLTQKNALFALAGVVVVDDDVVGATVFLFCNCYFETLLSSCLSSRGVLNLNFELFSEPKKVFFQYYNLTFFVRL